MNLILIIIFAMTLLYIAVANRLFFYIKLLALQGLVLFGMAYLELRSIDVYNLLFILLETLVVKAIVIPLFLVRIIKRNKITREAEPYVSDFMSLVAVTLGIILGVVLAHRVSSDYSQTLFLAGSIAGIFAGIFIIVTRRKIITHIMGYMVLENGIFVLALAAGSEMPMLVNAGILLDIFTSVLVLGVFANKIGDVFRDIEIGKLAKLRD
jgi:hydrogenase-4 component E